MPSRGTDRREELLGVGEPQGAPDRVDRVPPLVGASEELQDIALDEVCAGQVTPTLPGVLDLRGRDVDAGGVDALGGQGCDGVAAAAAEFDRSEGVAEEFVAGAVAVVLGPAEGVLDRLFRGLVGDAIGVVVPVAGTAGDENRWHAAASRLRDR
jgi:hypothetical protein